MKKKKNVRFGSCEGTVEQERHNMEIGEWLEFSENSLQILSL